MSRNESSENLAQLSEALPPTVEMRSLLSLPLEVLENIFERLHKNDLLNLALINTSMNELLESSMTFQQILLKWQHGNDLKVLESSTRRIKSLQYYGPDGEIYDCSDEVSFVVNHFQKTLVSICLNDLLIKASDFQTMLKKLSNLKYIYMSDVRYENDLKIDDTNAADLRKLESVTVFGSNIKLLRHFKSANITSLTLGFFKLENEKETNDEFIEFLATQPKLDFLFLVHFCHPSLFKAENLLKYQFQLQSLSFETNEIEWEEAEIKGFEEFWKVQNLSYLFIHLNEKGNAKFNLSVNHSIKNVYIKGPYFTAMEMTDGELAFIKCLRGLETLKCENFDVNHDLLNILCEFPNLKKVEWYDCKFTEMRSLPNVQEMVFSNRYSSRPNEFVECNRQLKKLTLENFHDVSFESLESLEYLDVSSSEKFKLATILQSNLKTVVLSKDFNDLALIESLKKMTVKFK